MAGSGAQAGRPLKLLREGGGGAAFGDLRSYESTRLASSLPGLK